jgi:hypothetical protein
LSLFKDQNNRLFFLCSRISLHKNIRLKINFNKGTTILEQPFTIKLGIQFNPTDFFGGNNLTALQESSLTKAVTEVWLQSESVDCTTTEGGNIKNELKVLRKCISKLHRNCQPEIED